MGASLSQILMNDAASCMCVHGSFLALGTYEGGIYLPDFIIGNYRLDSDK
jgi:hypothetical protein